MIGLGVFLTKQSLAQFVDVYMAKRKAEEMSRIRRFKITVAPVVIEVEGNETTKSTLNASPKAIVDLMAGDSVLLQAQIEEIEELAGVPTLELWQPQLPDVPPG